MSSPGFVRSFLACFLLLGSVLLCSTALAQRVNLVPGLWEYTNTLQMGEGEPRVQVFEGCVTQAELDDGDFMLQDIEACEMAEQTVTERRMDYVMNCQGPEGTQLSIEARITFDGERAEGVINNTVMTPMGDLAMAVNVSARRIGPCEDIPEDG